MCGITPILPTFDTRGIIVPMIPGLKAKKATKAEHKERLHRVEQLLRPGSNPTKVEWRISREFNIGRRQARKYITAVRAIYAHSPILSKLEVGNAALERSDQALELEQLGPSIRALEMYAQLHGYLDRTSKVTVEGSVAHTHVATAELSTEELLALQAFHDARNRRLTEGASVQTAPIESTAVEATADDSTAEGRTDH